MDPFVSIRKTENRLDNGSLDKKKIVYKMDKLTEAENVTKEENG